MITKREMRKRTKEEKERILLDIQRLGPVAGCRKHNLPSSLYYYWLEKYKARGIEGLNDQRGKDVQVAIRKLEKENMVLKELLAEKELELRMKDELLKKKMVHWERAKK